jgi:hypothetical protein
VQPPTREVPLSLAVASAVVTSNQALLSFSLPETGRACLELYDVRGARLATLRDGEAIAGRNQFAWSSGLAGPVPRKRRLFPAAHREWKNGEGEVVFAR